MALPSHAAEQDRLNRSNVYEAINLIQKHQYTADPVKTEQILGKIENLLEAMDDPYSYYMNPDEYSDFIYDMHNSFVGIGIQFKISDIYPEIAHVFDDTPAARNGILAGDKIIRLNGREVAGISDRDFANRMLGEPGSRIMITIRRGGVEDFDVLLVREEIHIPAVFHLVFEDGIGYIRLSVFSVGSSWEFRQAVVDLRRQDVTELIVDLRGNPGGSLDEAASIANMFLSPGKTIVNIVDVFGGVEKMVSKGRPIISGMSVVVLVDSNSASASELLSGSLQDNQVALIVGEKTFGKGTMQSVIPMADGAAVNLTTAEFYTPQGRPVHNVGITPSYQEVANPELQLAKARELLRVQRDKAVGQ